MRRFAALRRPLSRLRVIAILLPLAPAVAHAAVTRAATAAADGDVAAARAHFEKNLDAIRRHDREAYLACYLHADTLARTGPEGLRTGYDSFAKENGDDWPDLFEALDLDLVPMRPGLVYGTYRYRVRYGAREESGISERFFVETGSAKAGGARKDRAEPGDGWKIAVTTAFAAPPGTPPPPRALLGGTLVDGTGARPVPDSSVILRGGRIDCAGTRAQCPPPKGIDTLDLKGEWITPGIVDAHVHFSQTGWADGRPDSIDVRDRYPYEEVEAGLRAHPERFLRSYLCSGVTAVFDVGGYSWTWDLRARAEADPLAPHVAAAGPLLSTLDFWLNLPAERQFIYLGNEQDARTGVRYLASHGADAVKVWFIPVAERNFDEMAKAVLSAGEEARARKIPLIVHATGLREATAALRAGANLLVHSVGDVPLDEEFLRLAKENKTIYCPTLTVLDGYRRLREAAGEKKPPAVDDPNGCVDADTLARVAETARLPVKDDDPKVEERRRERIATFNKVAPANLKAVRDAGIAIAMGTDAGNPLTLHGPSVYAEMEAMQAAGMTPMEVLVASTRSGALAMHRQDEYGIVEKGKRGDLLVVGADPTRDIKNLRQLRYVIKGGVVRAQSELRAPATAAARGAAAGAAPVDAGTSRGGNVTAAELVTRWRKAIHAGEWDRSKTVVLASLSDQDGIPGTIEEWVTASGDYRRRVDRKFDRTEIVLAGGRAARLDWNGFVRNLRGKELERWRTEAFESAVIALGPPQEMKQAAVSQGDDRKLYLLRLTPPGGAPMTWYLSAETWLPAMTVRPGDDSEITTTYEDWSTLGGVTTPARARVTETAKPEYGWKRSGLRVQTGASRPTFQAPRPGPPDTHLDANAPPIPFNFESSHIIFKVGVNGREPIGFILDTGADENVIHARRLADYGLTTYAKSAATGGGGTAEYDYAEGATFTLPGVELRRQHVAVLDQSGLERALGVPLGGILGYDFLSRFVVEIDYEKKQITLHDPRTWSYSGSGIAVPVTFDAGIPFTDGTISVPTKPDIPAYFVLDFGAAETMTLTSPFMKANDLASLAGTNARVNRPAGLEKQFFAQNNVRGHIDRLALGRLAVESIPVNMSVNTQGAYASANFSGTVGEGIFHRYHVYLDYAHERVIFEPTPEAATPFPGRQTYGLSILSSGPDLRTYTVSAVRAGSPAETDGFKEGDTIAVMDGQPAEEFTLGDLRDRLSHQGDEHRIEIARSNEKLTLAIKVRLISLDAR